MTMRTPLRQPETSDERLTAIETYLPHLATREDVIVTREYVIGTREYVERSLRDHSEKFHEALNAQSHRISAQSDRFHEAMNAQSEKFHEAMNAQSGRFLEALSAQSDKFHEDLREHSEKFYGALNAQSDRFHEALTVQSDRISDQSDRFNAALLKLTADMQAQMRSDRRWMMGTVITAGLAIAALIIRMSG